MLASVPCEVGKLHYNSEQSHCKVIRVYWKVFYKCDKLLSVILFISKVLNVVLMLMLRCLNKKYAFF